MNEKVWSRSIDGLDCVGIGEEISPADAAKDAAEGRIRCEPEFTRKSPFCTNCYQAYSQRDDCWTRVMGSPADFKRPLSSAILNFPFPEKKHILYGVGYSQSFGGWLGNVYYQDDFSCWFRPDISPPLLVAARDYASVRKLRLKIDSSHDWAIFVRGTYSEGQPPEDLF